MRRLSCLLCACACACSAPPTTAVNEARPTKQAAPEAHDVSDAPAPVPVPVPGGAAPLASIVAKHGDTPSPSEAPQEACAALKAELELELEDEGEDEGVLSCRNLRSESSDGFEVELLELELDDPFADDYRVLYLATMQGAQREFEEVSEARSVPGNDISFAVSPTERRGQVVQITVVETDQTFATGDPESGDITSEDTYTKIVSCDFAQRTCTVDSP